MNPQPTSDEKWQAQAARFALLSEVVLIISELSEFESLVKKTIGKLKWVIDFERCTLSLLEDEGGDTYETKVLFESRREASKAPMRRRLSEGLAGEVIRTGRMRLIYEGGPDSEPLPTGGDPEMEGAMPTVLSVPVRAYDRNLGALSFGTRRDRGFSREDIKVAVSFATHLALAVDRCRTTQKLKEARDYAEQATQAKSRFLANMTHELRTPLNAVIGITEMLLEDAEEDDSENLEPLTRIFNAGKHLLALINDVLDLSKIEAGAVELHNERFHVADLLEDIEHTVVVLATKNDNRLTVEAPETPLVMCADVTRFRQILLNLLSNACKFTEAGTVRLEASVERCTLGEWLVCDVSDTGIGMTEDQLAGLFREFSQADASTTRKYGGTGLGLAISKRLAESMGGTIAVQSEPDVGTTFTLRLPINAPPCRGSSRGSTDQPPAMDGGLSR